MMAGAEDVFITPIVMKKGRPAHNITVICEPKRVNDILGILFTETTTIGVRYDTINRVKLSREELVVKTELGPVRIKVAKIGTDVVNAQPEYEDIAAISRDSGVSMKEVYRIAVASYENSRKV